MSPFTPQNHVYRAYFCWQRGNKRKKKLFFYGKSQHSFFSRQFGFVWGQKKVPCFHHVQSSTPSSAMDGKFKNQTWRAHSYTISSTCIWLMWADFVGVDVAVVVVAFMCVCAWMCLFVYIYRHRDKYTQENDIFLLKFPSRSVQQIHNTQFDIYTQITSEQSKASTERKREKKNKLIKHQTP